MPFDAETITKIQAGIPKLGPFETREEALRATEAEGHPPMSYIWPPEQKEDGKWWVRYLWGSTTTLLEPLEPEQ